MPGELPEPKRTEAAAVCFSLAHTDDTDTLLLLLWDTGQLQILADSWSLKWNFSEVLTGFHQFLIREEESLKTVFLEEAEAFGLSKPHRTLSWKTKAVLEVSP